MQNYEYDDLHRLAWAGGEYKRDADSTDTYTNTFVYDTIGNMLNKDQQHNIVHTDGSVSPRPHTTYNLAYEYGSSRPHAATHIGGKTYEYDLNGNLERWTDDQTKREMLFTWNEDNQLLRTEEQGKLTIYRYDDAGTRVIKRGKYGEVLYVNTNYSLRNGEVGTKHVFAGNTRIATKITMKEQKLNASKATYDKSEGGHNGRIPEKSNGNRLGWGKKIDTGTPVHESQGNAYGHEKQAEREHEIPGQLKQLDKAGGSAENAKGKGKSKTNGNANAKSQDKAHPHNYQYDTDLPGKSEKGLENALAHGKGHKYGIYKRLARRGLIVNSSGDIVPIGSVGDDVSGDDGDGSGTTPTVGNAMGAVPDEFGIYYYHGDHLGSSNIITDRKGRNYEHVEYFPYGETWVDEQRNTTHLPYRFTGKELDPETGMYYFGARYYEPVASMWLSTDPALNKYLEGKVNNGVMNSKNLGLYSYTYNNPVVIVDPDGKENIGIAMFKKGGEKGTFNGRAVRAVEQSGGSRSNVYNVHTGQGFIEALVEASKNEPIDKLYVASHSGPTGLYGDSNSGFYSGPISARINNLVVDGWDNYAPPTENAAYLSDLKEKIASGEILFAEDAEIVFLGCNTARGGYGIDSFIEDFSESVPDVFVTGAEGYTAPTDAQESSFTAKKDNPDHPGNPTKNWVTYQDGSKVRDHGSTYSPGNE